MSGANEPVAWAVTPTGKDADIDCEFIYPDPATAGDVALGCSGVVVPLYSHPPLTLTDAEREAVAFFADIHCDDEPPHEYAVALRSLLKRLLP
jgi:hypothetical protein